MADVVTCKHRTAYECAACGEQRCMECDALCAAKEIKTAVRWCPAHAEDGKMGRLEVEKGAPLRQAKHSVEYLRSLFSLLKCNERADLIGALLDGYCIYCGTETNGRFCHCTRDE